MGAVVVAMGYPVSWYDCCNNKGKSKVTMTISSEIYIRKATLEDLPHVLNWIDEGSREGHFFQQPLDAIKSMLRQVHEKGTIERLCDRGIEKIQAWLWIAQLDDHRCGFILCSTEQPSSDAIELYKISTDKAFRRQGIATALAKHALASFPETRRFIARCNKKSTWASSMLEKLGFRYISTTLSGQRRLERSA